MKCENWTVKPDDVRPARPDGTCFYCRIPLGGEHEMGCVIRRKTVVVDVTMRLVIRVPEDWDAGSVEFHINGSSACSDRFISYLQNVTSDERCMCDRTYGHFIGEASKEDEERYGICN